MKMEEINKSIKELWTNTYRGTGMLHTGQVAFFFGGSSLFGDIVNALLSLETQFFYFNHIWDEPHTFFSTVHINYF